MHWVANTVSSEYILIFVAVGNRSEAKSIALHLVEHRLAACVGIIDQSSIYRWKEKVTEDKESLLTIKTTRAKFNSIKDAILTLHSYEIPEIIGIDITEGSLKYLDWISNSVS